MLSSIYPSVRSVDGMVLSWRRIGSSAKQKIQGANEFPISTRDVMTVAGSSLPAIFGTDVRG